MWLDYCDENKTPHGNPLTLKKYVKKYKSWLLEQYAKESNE